MRPKRVHFHVNALKPRAKAAHKALAALLPHFGLSLSENGGDADIVIALGGDGTILKAAKLNASKPVVGFNLGGLGYLASVERRDFKKALAMIAEGRYKISKRTMLEAVKPGDGKSRAVALNDIVLMRELSGHAAVLDLAVDGKCAARYFADGLVFATPTGSTAYSLSAGGPVLMPDSASFVVTPMNPHALGIRPIVLSDEVAITVTTRSRDEGRGGRIGVYADGENAIMLDDDGTVEIRRAHECALMVELDGYSPYEVLSRKLGWTDARVRLPARGGIGIISRNGREN